MTPQRMEKVLRTFLRDKIRISPVGREWDRVLAMMDRWMALMNAPTTREAAQAFVDELSKDDVVMLNCAGYEMHIWAKAWADGIK